MQILRRIKAREMLACNFARKIPLKPLGAQIPADDPALGIEHVNCVIGDALHEAPELLLASPHALLGVLALGRIARDFCKSDKISAGVADRVDDDVSPEVAAVLADTPAFAFELAVLG